MTADFLEPYILPLCALLAFTGLILVMLELYKPGSGTLGIGIVFLAIGIFGEYREMANRQLRRTGKYDYKKTRINQKWF